MLMLFHCWYNNLTYAAFGLVIASMHDANLDCLNCEAVWWCCIMECSWFERN